MDTLIRRFREHAVQGTAGPSSHPENWPGGSSSSTDCPNVTHTDELRELSLYPSISVPEWKQRRTRPTTCIQDGWATSGSQLPQEKPADAPCLSVKGGDTSLNLHMGPLTKVLCAGTVNRSLRAGESELHHACTQQSQAGHRVKPWTQQRKATQKRGWTRKLGKKG